MIDHLLAGAVITIHAAFVLFVVAGGFLALRWHRLVWVHVPAAVWGVLIEYGGWICPLTPLENTLRARAGVAGYSGGFIEHYILRTLYPSGLDSHARLALGSFALLVNVAAYTLIVRLHTRSKRPVTPA
ncbi:MAG: DUF2784 domain-containing protein [Gemmatimonadota bacterium]